MWKLIFLVSRPKSYLQVSRVIVDVAIIVGGIEKLMLSQSGEEPSVDIGLHFVVDGRRKFELVEDFNTSDVVEIALASPLRSHIWIQKHQPG